MGHRREILTALALLVALVAGLAACGVEEEGLVQEPIEDQGDFKLVYEDETISAENVDVYELLQESGFLDSAVENLNENLKLPADIELLVTEDLPRWLSDGPAYVPDDKTIVLPASFLTESAILLQAYDDAPGGSFQSREFGLADATLGAILFVAYHEMGHALVDQLELPITGREEDSVDALAAVLTTADPEHDVLPSLSAALLFDAYAELGGEPTITDYADEHLLDRQRVYQFLCYVLGSDPDLFWEDLVGPGVLPPARAELCADEWDQASHGWFTLLAPYVKEDSGFAQQLEEAER